MNDSQKIVKDVYSLWKEKQKKHQTKAKKKKKPKKNQKTILGGKKGPSGKQGLNIARKGSGSVTTPGLNRSITHGKSPADARLSGGVTTPAS